MARFFSRFSGLSRLAQKAREKMSRVNKNCMDGVAYMEDEEKNEEKAAENNPLPMDGNGTSQGASAEEPQVPMVAMSMGEFETLQHELEQVRSQSNEYFDGWQRERADFMNYKKRVERDSIQARQNALSVIVKKYLVILDDLERALKARPTEGEGAVWAEGITLIHRKLGTLLEQEGVKRMEAEKEIFDPNRHEAIMLEDSADHTSGQIIEVIQQGYLLGDRVIRPAIVRVAR
jgi:molecular chaperone GrpE